MANPTYLEVEIDFAAQNGETSARKPPRYMHVGPRLNGSLVWRTNPGSLDLLATVRLVRLGLPPPKVAPVQVHSQSLTHLHEHQSWFDLMPCPPSRQYPLPHGISHPRGRLCSPTSPRPLLYPRRLPRIRRWVFPNRSYRSPRSAC